jgi:hypothetical protein
MCVTDVWRSDAFERVEWNVIDNVGVSDYVRKKYDFGTGKNIGIKNVIIDT